MREMKDSGIEWIKQIPTGWTTTRGKNILQLMKRPPEADDEVITCFRNGEVTLRRNRREEGFTFSDKEIGYQGIKKGDLVIHGMDGFAGAIGISDSDGKGSPVLVVCTTKENARYLVYYLRTLAMQDVFLALATGIRERSCDLRWNKIAGLLFPVPELNEQCRIADYLDRKCGQIDAIIARQQEVIEKLKAYKLSVITEAVTKGLNPNVPMTDSGVEWVGEIPKHWIVSQLKYYASLRSGLTLGKKYPPDSKLIEVPYLRVANVQGDYIKLDDVATVFVQQEEIDKYSLHKGELLMTEGGDRDKLGRGCMWNGEIQPCLHQNHVFAVTTDTGRLSTEYLNYVTSSNVARTYFDYTAKKTTNLASTNSTTILQFKFPIPPLEEQGAIVSYLDTKCAKINSWLNNTELVISKLQDYKKSLIYEVVTGKKEV